jgi:hypothetical protein
VFLTKGENKYSGIGLFAQDKGTTNSKLENLSNFDNTGSKMVNSR